MGNLFYVQSSIENDVTSDGFGTPTNPKMTCTIPMTMYLVANHMMIA